MLHRGSRTKRVPFLFQVISGGQTGVDRAALDLAIARGIPCGGWCPAGRWAEDGPLNARYPLRETPSADPAQRTAWNVRDSDATLVLYRAEIQGGTALTLREAERLGRPRHARDLNAAASADPVRHWLRTHRPYALNIAGPRQSEAPGVYQQTIAFLEELFPTDDPDPCEF